MLGVPTVADRIAQTVVTRVLASIPLAPQGRLQAFGETSQDLGIWQGVTPAGGLGRHIILNRQRQCGLNFGGAIVEARAELATLQACQPARGFTVRGRSAVACDLASAITHKAGILSRLCEKRWRAIRR